MEVRVVVLAMVVSLSAWPEGTGEFRLIGALPATSRDANVSLSDWDGDGDLDLIHTDRVDQYALSHASHNLYLAQIYEPLNGQWDVKNAFVFRWDSNRSDGVDGPDREPEIHPILPWGREVSESVAARELTGDFNSDGLPDKLVAETIARASLEGLGESCVLRIKQNGGTVFEDLLFEFDATGPNFEKLQTVDFDKDGTMEVLVWLSTGGWGAPYAFLYGTPNSRWAAPVPLQEPPWAKS